MINKFKLNPLWNLKVTLKKLNQYSYSLSIFLFHYNVLYQVCAFRADLKNTMAPASD